MVLKGTVEAVLEPKHHKLHHHMDDVVEEPGPVAGQVLPLGVQPERQLVEAVVSAVGVLLQLAQGLQALGYPLPLPGPVVAVHAQHLHKRADGLREEGVDRLRPLRGEGEGRLLVQGGRVAEELGVAPDEGLEGGAAKQLGAVRLQAEHDQEGAHQYVGTVPDVAELCDAPNQLPEGPQPAQLEDVLQLGEYGAEVPVAPVAGQDGVGLVARGEEMLVDDGVEPHGQGVLGVQPSPQVHSGLDFGEDPHTLGQFLAGGLHGLWGAPAHGEHEGEQGPRELLPREECPQFILTAPLLDPVGRNLFQERVCPLLGLLEGGAHGGIARGGGDHPERGDLLVLHDVHTVASDAVPHVLHYLYRGLGEGPQGEVLYGRALLEVEAGEDGLGQRVTLQPGGHARVNLVHDADELRGRVPVQFYQSLCQGFLGHLRIVREILPLEGGVHFGVHHFDGGHGIEQAEMHLLDQLPRGKLSRGICELAGDVYPLCFGDFH